MENRSNRVAFVLAIFAILCGVVPIFGQCSISVNLGNDTTLCQGQSLTINPGTYSNYLWDNGSTFQTRSFNQTGSYHIRVGNVGANLITNGDFEQGNTGFTTDYGVGTGGSWGPVSNAGTYLITTSPNLAHTNFSSCTDHTTAPGVNMIVVNGASAPNTNVWCQTIAVQQNTTYQFGTWVSSALTDPTVAQLQFNINSSSLGPIFSPSQFGCTWSQFFQTWNSGLNTSAQICIVNQNISGGGNDFLLDDITFRPICFAYDTIQITVSPNPIVNLGPDINTCEGTPIALDAGNPGLSYTWSTTETSQQIAPTISGNYTVTVQNAFNCSGSDNINVNFETQKYAGNDSMAVRCQTASGIDLNNLKSSNSTTNGNWTSTDFTGNLNPNGNISLANESGTFHFLYTVSGVYCPNDTAEFTLNLNIQGIAAPNTSLHVCNTSGEVENISNLINHPSNPADAYWAFSPNFTASNFDSISNDILLGNLQHGNYTLYNILKADSACVQDTFLLQLQVTAVPVPSFTISSSEGCTPVTVSFENQSIAQGNLETLWDFGDGTNSTSYLGSTHTYTNPQCYDVSLSILADNLCAASVTIPNIICVHPIPVAAFTYNPQQVYSDGPTVQFDNNSSNNQTNYWDFGDGFSATTENPEHTFPVGDIGNYGVQLIVVSEFGCADTVTGIVMVKDQLIFYVPNSFTPDADEFNPVFIPVLTAGIDLNDYQMLIFNRWGELLFETTDVFTGWDGTYKGQLQKEGMYIWKLNFGLMESDARKEVTGHLNLLK